MAASFNKVIIVGTLTRDVELKHTSGGTAIAELNLAINRKWFDKSSNEQKTETTYVEVTLWGRTGEVAAEYLAKASQVLIEGRLHLDQWDDRTTGQKRSKLKVIGESMTMLSGGNKGESRGSSKPKQSEPTESSGEPQSDDVDVDNIPF